VLTGSCETSSGTRKRAREATAATVSQSAICENRRGNAPVAGQPGQAHRVAVRQFRGLPGSGGMRLTASYRSRARLCLCSSDGNSYLPGLVPLFPSRTTLLIRMDVHPFHVHSFLHVLESLMGQPPAAFSRRINRAAVSRENVS
jgi:hypothetical protein